MSDESYDIVIIGAGLSGIGAAVHFGRECPSESVALFESREAMGGTWDLFRYPGIRSDSDMFTLGYSFKPWLNSQAIADGSLIRKYINDAADEYRVKDKIQFQQRITSANWDSNQQRWLLEVTDQRTHTIKSVTAKFVMGCTGYYNYQSGYEPEFVGKSDFNGTIVHPQHWPEALDYEGKRVVIIGSGATAVTLAPAMAKKAKQITLLQRSPSYVMSMPKVDPKLEVLREKFSPKLYYRLVRARNVTLSFLVYQYCKFFPKKARNFLQGHVQESIGDDVDMKHFTPKYDPWDERVCAVTDGDLFEAVKDGDVIMHTDHIERFNEDGLLLKSGKQLSADIIITATGLNLQLLGGMELSVDNQPFDMTKKMCYRGVLLEDLPNMGFVFGYTNASWTLKADLVLKYVARVINRMKKTSMQTVMPKNTGDDPGGIPFIDLQSGYVMRGKDLMPQQGQKLPWRLYQNYLLDFLTLKFGRLNDGKLTFSNSQGHSAAPATPLNPETTKSDVTETTEAVS
ncbi:MAG: flavin-containing monooxygenase [Cellvibrionaceae bacterium]